MDKKSLLIKVASLCLLLAAGVLTLAACSVRDGFGAGGNGKGGTLKAAAIPSVSAPRDVAAVLAELDALNAPGGVDAATFDMLKTAVGDALRQRADARVVSAAPGLTLGQIDAAIPVDAGQYTISFSWSERNPGDYDLSGEVNLQDLAVLAVNYGKQRGAQGWAQARVADGNGDGKLDTQDAVAIAENLLTRISGYAVYRSLPGGSSPDLLGRVARDQAVVLAGVVVQYSFEDKTVDGPSQAYLYEVRPYGSPDGTGEGIASQSFTLRAGQSYGVPPQYAVETIVDAQRATRRIVAGEVLITFEAAPTREQLLNAVYEQAGGELLGQIPGSFTFRVRLPQDALRAVASVVAQTKSASASDGYIIEPNYLVPGPAPMEKISGSAGGGKSSSMSYSDPLRSQLWGLDAVYADVAWDTAEGAGVVVAVIDSGVETSHEDLAGQTVDGARFGGSDAWSDDTCGHGTHVAGTIAAAAGNGKGVVGLSNKVKIMPLRCGADYGGSWSFPVSDLSSAINYAVANGAKAINMSLGGKGALGTAFEAALANAESNGVVVLAAAGNDNVSAQGFYPATYPTVVSVGAIGPALARAPFSNFGYPDYVDICAPGGDGTYAGAILSTVPTSASSYERMQGTSMACPHATAVAALILSASPGMTAQQVRTVLHDTGRTVAGSAQVGPLVNAQAALAALGAPGTVAVSGSVRRADNSAIAGVSIALAGAANRTVDTDASGNFTVPGVPNGIYTLTPAKAGYSFQPASLSVTVSGVAVTGQNFTGAQGAGGESENNDTTAQANALPDLPFDASMFSGSLGSGAGYSGSDGDAADFLKFTIAAPMRVSFSLNFNSSTGNLDLRLLSTNGTTVLATSTTTIAPETVGASLLTAGTYFLKCTRVSGFSDYTVAATAVPAYNVAGKVTKKADGKALAGVTLTVAGNGVSLAAKTAATGEYSIAGVPDGGYTLTPSLTGRSFTPASANVSVSGGNVSGVNFQVEGPYTVGGAVYMKNGTALAGALLGLTGNGSTLSAVSGEDGRFSVANVANGSYILTCSATGRSFAPASATVTVSGANVMDCYFLGEGPFSVSGTITSPSGASLGSVTLKLTGGGYSLSTTSSALGKYAISGAPNGAYTLTPTSRGRTFTPASRTVTIQSGNISGVNFTGEGPFTVSGNVTNQANGAPVASVKVTLSGQGLTLSATTSSTGDYSIAYVPNGAYTLTATRTGRVFAPAAKNVSVAGSNVTGLSFSSYPVYAVSGKITLSSAALAGVTLNLSGNGGTFEVQTNASGVYSLTGIPAGTYTLAPSLSGRSFTPAEKSISVISANIVSQNFTAK
jgi:subtilisin family serine protease